MMPLLNGSERYENDSNNRRFSVKLLGMGEPKSKRPWVAWTLLALGAIERVVGWGGSIDFILSRWNEPAWVGSLMGGLIEYSNVIGLVLLLGGIALLIRHERRRTDALLERLQSPITKSDVSSIEPVPPPLAAIPLTTLPVKERSAVLAMLREIETFLVERVFPLHTDSNHMGSLAKRCGAVGVTAALDELREIGAKTDSVTADLHALLHRHQADINNYGLAVWDLPADLQLFRGRTQEVISRCLRAGDVPGEVIEMVASEPRTEAAQAMGALVTKIGQARDQIGEMRRQLSQANPA